MADIPALLECPAGEKRELYISRKSGFSVSTRDGAKSDEKETRDSFAASMRIMRGARMGFACTTAAGKLAALPEKAAETLFPAEKWGWDIMAPPDSSEKDYGIYDEATASADREKLWDGLFDMERRAKTRDSRIKKTLGASFASQCSEVTVANSLGMFRRIKKTLAEVSMSLIAEESAEVAVGGSYAASCRLGNIENYAVADEAADDTVGQLGKITVPGPGRMKVLFSPAAASDLMDILSPWFCADEFLEKRVPSVWKEGAAAASEKLSVYDDATLASAAGSLPFDGEGAGTSRHEIIKKGIFTNYLTDSRTAGLLGRESTGNASRSAFSLPRVGLFNLYAGPGGETRQQLLSSGEIFIIDELIGTHLVSAENARFSVGARGRLSRSGKTVAPVRGVTISGDFLELLKNIEGVGNDLKFYGSVGSPSLLVKDVQVSGK